MIPKDKRDQIYEDVKILEDVIIRGIEGGRENNREGGREKLRERGRREDGGGE